MRRWAVIVILALSLPWVSHAAPEGRWWTDSRGTRFHLTFAEDGVEINVRDPQRGRIRATMSGGAYDNWTIVLSDASRTWADPGDIGYHDFGSKTCTFTFLKEPDGKTLLWMRLEGEVLVPKGEPGRWAPILLAFDRKRAMEILGDPSQSPRDDE